MNPETAKKRTDAGRVIRKVTWIGAGANLVLAVGKVVTGLLCASQSLLADGIHSFSDLISDGAVLIGERFWNAAPDDDHPYGHGRIETLVSLIIGMLLAVAALGICWRALSGMEEAVEGMVRWPVLAAALASIVIKEWLYRMTITAGHRVGSRALVANAWHHRTDALSSLPVALAVTASWVMPEFTHLDHVAAVMVSVLLFKAAWDIGWPCLRELVDVEAGDDVVKRLEDIRTKEGFGDIREIHRVRARRVGSAVIVDLHMLVTGNMSVRASHELAERLEAWLKNSDRSITDVTVHVEPWEEESLSPP